MQNYEIKPTKKELPIIMLRISTIISMSLSLKVIFREKELNLRRTPLSSFSLNENL